MADRPKLTARDLAVRQKNRELLALSQNPAFLNFVFDLFRDARIFYPTYTRGDPNDTSYQEGRRSLGLEVLHSLENVDPDFMVRVLQAGNMKALLDTATQQQSPDDQEET